MESNEVLVLYNFYSRVAKTTGIVKMSRKPFLMFSIKGPILLKIKLIQQIFYYFPLLATYYGMVHLGRIFELGALLFYGKSLWIDKNGYSHYHNITSLILKLSLEYDYVIRKKVN